MNDKKEVAIISNSEMMLKDLENTKKMCEMLMQTTHYSKIGSEGIYAIVEKAKSTGISPTEALNGGFYFVQGKVEMSSALMNDLIRRAGHSITKDKESNDAICILHGKRKDTGDTWSESFSIEDAKLAGIYRNQWLKYPRDMLFARALSRLARQLFPDIIHGCYVEGEIKQSIEAEKAPVIVVEHVNVEQIETIRDMLLNKEEIAERFMSYLQETFGIEDIEEIPLNLYDGIVEKLKIVLEKELLKA